MQRSLSWLLWAAVGIGGQGVGQFVLLAVLARRLSPEEFGIVTATMIVVGLGRMFIEGSTGPALVQRERLEPAHVRAGFAVALYTALFLMGVSLLSAPFVESFFAMPGLAPVMRALSLVFLFLGLGIVPEALLQRELKLKAIAFSDNLSSLVGLMMTGVVLALAGFGIWALVLAVLCQMFLKAVALLLMRPHERALVPDARAARELWEFSGGFLTARVFNYSAGHGDNFVVAKWMSAETLGIYGRAVQLMTMPAMLLGEIIGRVLFPALARHQTDRPRLLATYRRGIELSASLMLPAAAGGILAAPEIVRVVLGPDWDAVIVPFQILAAILVARMGYKISDSLAQATGTVYERAWRQAVFAVLVVGGAFLGKRWGVEGVAIGHALAIVANYLLMADLSRRTTGLAWHRFAALHGRGLVLAAGFGLLVAGATRGLRSLEAPSWAVLLGGLFVPAGLAVLGAWKAPRAVLGEAGEWLIGKLRSRGSGHE